ncbi:MAG: T9SS type A sorting domain-containing protein [Chitinophagales bacterium]|nr:T9SS type A sorting domain-containing protein [Bacteroidota bacterium]MBP8916610.1 T9SS type A sorting domain-containing protein [Chitinophagales bacterium]MBP9220054.1 T9SS type A sorting domain-containing protein [Chitinophagales bacterium]MBP9794711.1 T9SS type A sorting domain-containing protein [Chitinophagales bacterium]
MKKLLIICCCLFLATASDAQITFEKTFSTIGESIANDAKQTSDGGYIVVGTSNYSYMSSGEILLIKTNAQGDTIWTRMFGGVGADQGNAVMQTLDGGYMVAGATNSFGAGGLDAYLIKTDAGGNLLWTKTIGTAGNDAAYGIVQTADSGYVFSGNELTYGINGFAHLVKTDKNGNVVWSKTFGNSIRKNYIFSLEQTSDNGFIMGGYENNFISTNDEFSMIKADSAGNMVWYKTYGDMYFDHNFSVCEAADGGYAIAGINFELGGYNFDVNIIKTDMDGIVEWTKKYGGAGHEDVYSIEATEDGGFVFAGSSSSFSPYQNAFITKTDSIGNVIWSKTMNGTGYDILFSAEETADGGFVFSGVKDEVDGVSGDLFLVKTDADGNTACNNSVSGYEIIPPTISGPLFSTGNSTPIVYFQTPEISGGAIINSLCCEVPSGLFTNNITTTKAKLNWTPEPGAIQYEVWYKKSGAPTWKIKFVPGINNKLNLKNLKCNKGYEWQIRTICDTAGVDQVSGFSVLLNFTTLPCRESEFIVEENLLLYPNPASGQFTIECFIPETNTDAIISIYDLNGKVMFQQRMDVLDGELTKTINSENYPSGIYIIKIVSGSIIETQNIIINK